MSISGARVPSRGCFHRLAVSFPLLLVLVCATGGPAASPAAARQPCPDEHLQIRAETVAAVRAALACLTNEQRTSRGLPSLTLDPRLDGAAQSHAEDMVRRAYFSHTAPEGNGPSDRARDQGYEGGAGENIAYGHASARLTIAQWMESDGHCRNILGAYDDLGVGATPGSPSNAAWAGTWVQAFGREDGAAGFVPAARDGCPYVLDGDLDGARDLADNCIDVANADQADLDEDRLGNACDPDRDGDEKPNDVDLYPDENDLDRAPVDLVPPERVVAGRAVRLVVLAQPSSKITFTISRGRSRPRVLTARPRNQESGRADVIEFATRRVHVNGTSRITVTDGVSEDRTVIRLRAAVRFTRLRLSARSVLISARVRPRSARTARVSVRTGRGRAVRRRVRVRRGRFSTRIARPAGRGRTVVSVTIRGVRGTFSTTTVRRGVRSRGRRAASAANLRHFAAGATVQPEPGSREARGG